jgi:hypothetical protein
MSKLASCWLMSSAAAFALLCLPVSLLSTLRLGIGWGLLGAIFVSGAFGFYYCTSATPRNEDWSSSFGDNESF